MPSLTDARLDLLLAELKLPTIRRSHRKTAEDVSQAGGDYASYLCALVEEEVAERGSRRVQRRLKEARFPQTKLIAELDEKALPKGIAIAQLHELCTGTYLDEAVNVLAVGGSGTGKTHVSIGLGVEACKQGRRVRFYTATELVSALEEAQENHQLHRFLKRIGALDLLIVDELGYVPVTEQGAQLLFQAFSERHERASTILNTNLPFSDWAQVFKTERLAVAMLDRVTHRAQILEMNGESYRLRSAKAKGQRSQKK
jgi:DNA replication protein DnaC